MPSNASVHLAQTTDIPRRDLRCSDDADESRSGAGRGIFADTTRRTPSRTPGSSQTSIDRRTPAPPVGSARSRGSTGRARVAHRVFAHCSHSRGLCGHAADPRPHECRTRMWNRRWSCSSPDPGLSRPRTRGDLPRTRTHPPRRMPAVEDSVHRLARRRLAGFLYKRSLASGQGNRAAVVSARMSRLETVSRS